MVLTEQATQVFCLNVSNTGFDEGLVGLCFVVGINHNVLAAPSAFHDGYEAEAAWHLGDAIGI